MRHETNAYARTRDPGVMALAILLIALGVLPAGAAPLTAPSGNALTENVIAGGGDRADAPSGTTLDGTIAQPAVGVSTAPSGAITQSGLPAPATTAPTGEGEGEGLAEGEGMAEEEAPSEGEPVPEGEPPTGLTVTAAGDTSVTKPEGSSHTFAVTVANAQGDPDFQWKFEPASAKAFTNLVDGGNISGATTASLTIDPITPANEGAYKVTVSDLTDSQDSPVFTLTVGTPLPALGLLGLTALAAALGGALSLRQRRRA